MQVQDVDLKKNNKQQVMTDFESCVANYFWDRVLEHVTKRTENSINNNKCFSKYFLEKSNCV